MKQETSSQMLQFSRYTRLGCWIVVVSISTILFVELFKRVPAFNERILWGVAALEVLGLILMIDQIGRYFRKETPEEIMSFTRNPHFWGAALLVIGVLVYLCCPRIVPAPPVLPPPPVKRAPVPEVVVPPEPVVFPEITVKAVVVNGPLSTATINGEIVEIGRRVLGATLVGVSEDAVTLEMQGERKVYRIGAAPALLQD